MEEANARFAKSSRRTYQVLSDASRRAMYDTDLSASCGNVGGCARDGSANVDTVKQDTNPTSSTSSAT
ncbi:unnamed protein product [Urochloa humidicola]